jgi:hypothetical protein
MCKQQGRLLQLPSCLGHQHPPMTASHAPAAQLMPAQAFRQQQAQMRSRPSLQLQVVSHAQGKNLYLSALSQQQMRR